MGIGEAWILGCFSAFCDSIHNEYQKVSQKSKKEHYFFSSHLLLSKVSMLQAFYIVSRHVRNFFFPAEPALPAGWIRIQLSRAIYEYRQSQNKVYKTFPDWLTEFDCLSQIKVPHGSKFCLSSEVGNFTPAQPNSLVGPAMRYF